VARRQLLTEEERRLLFGIPHDPDALTRHYSFTRSDRELLTGRRGNANRLGFAVQLALLRHPGMGLAQMEEPVDALVAWLAERLKIQAAAFTKYAGRAQTMTDHARILAAALGLRTATAADLPFMIEAAAQSAWSADRGPPIVASVIAALRAENVILPAPRVLERAAIAGRARARKHAADAMLAGVSEQQLAMLDKLSVVDPALKATPLAWLRSAPTSPKADHVGELIDRLRFVRSIGLSADSAARIHADRFHQFVREGRISDPHQLGRYTAHRRRAILAANIIDLEARLTDALLDMADKLIGGLFGRARRAKERRYVASTRDVGRLMRLFDGTIEALAIAQREQRDGFIVVDEVVGWAKLQRVRSDVRKLVDLAEEDPLLGAADRYRTLRKFAPELIEALEFKAARCNDPTLSAIKLLQELNRSGKREVPPDAPMPFRKDWKRLVTEEGSPNRRLYETAVLATLRDKLRSGDVWIERSANYRSFDSYLLPLAGVPAIAAKLRLPATADEWLARRGAELDERLKYLACRLRRRKPRLWLPESTPCCRACGSPRSCTKSAEQPTWLRPSPTCAPENAATARMRCLRRSSRMPPILV
jgi:Domain of unknown function (DUF4158)